MPADDPVAQRDPHDTFARETIVDEKILRVPVNDCDDDIGCCGNCSTGRHRVRPDMIVVVLACGYILRRKSCRRDQPRPRR